MQYSLPYILILIFVFIIAVIQLGIPLDDRSRKFVNLFVVIAYVLFFGFRGFIATDWIGYFYYYKDLPTDISIALQKPLFEKGFVIYSVIIKKFTNDYEIFQLIGTLTNVFLLHLFFKRYLPLKYYSLGFAVFLVYYGLGFEVNLLRNFKALLIFLTALPFIESRQPFKYFLLIIVAAFFHWSSLFFFPLYFFLHKAIPMRIFLTIFVVGSLVYLTQLHYITPIIKLFASVLPVEESLKITKYLDSTFYSQAYGFTFGYFERTLLAFLILFYYKKITKSTQNILFVNSFLIFISLYLYCSEITIILDRVAGIFAYAYWIMIPLIIINLERNIKPFALIFISLFFIFKMYMITNFVFYQYDSFLSPNHKTYEQRYEIYKNNQKLFK